MYVYVAVVAIVKERREVAVNCLRSSSSSSLLMLPHPNLVDDWKANGHQCVSKITEVRQTTLSAYKRPHTRVHYTHFTKN